MAFLLGIEICFFQYEYLGQYDGLALAQDIAQVQVDIHSKCPYLGIMLRVTTAQTGPTCLTHLVIVPQRTSSLPVAGVLALRRCCD